MSNRRVIDLDEVSGSLALEVAVALENHRRERLQAEREARRNGTTAAPLPFGFTEVRDTFHSAALAALGRTAPQDDADWSTLVDAVHMPTKMLRVDQAAGAINCSKRAVEGLIAAGSLPAVNIPGVGVRVRVSDLDQYVADAPPRVPTASQTGSAA